ncbi:MAG: carboxy terminal-processing peptidase [Acidobacteriota bacterium]
MRRSLLIALLAACACSAKPPSGTPPAGERTLPVAPTASAQPAAPAPADPPAHPSDPREAALARTVARLLEHDHLLHKKLDDELSRAAFTTYLDHLDGAKLFLLKSDRDELGRYADKIDDEMHSGSLDLAHAGEKIFVERVEQVDKIVASLLAKPLNLDDQEFIETDPKKLEPPANDQELADRWRKRLELEVLERVGQMETRLDKEKKAREEQKTKKPGAKAPAAGSASDSDSDRADDSVPLNEIPPTTEGREAKARSDLAKMYAGRFARLRHPGQLDAASDLINAVTATLDPHTDYLPPAEKANFDIQMTGSLEGIGASLREHDDYIEVVEIVPGGAAYRQGKLAPNDTILAVQSDGKDWVDVVDMRLDDVVKMIRGPKGTTVRLRVRKPDGHEETIAITRDVIVIEESYARGALLQRGGKTYGYIHLPEFYGGPDGSRTASADVHRLLKELAKKKVAGVVLDIRSNGGGLLQDAVKLTGEMIDKGPVVQVRDSAGHKEVLDDDDSGEDYAGPLIVLVDRFSASASEILAGALQDYHRAVIVGTGPSTHGKGTVQKLVDLDRVSGAHDDLGVLKITVEQFFRVSGASTQLEGVVPDIVLPDPTGYLDTGERKLDHAIAWSQIAPAPHDDWKATWKVPALVQKSTMRVAKSPVLSKIAAANQILRAQREDTRMPLQYTAWEARRKTLQTALDSASPDLSKAKPALAVTPIDGNDTAASAPGPGVKPDARPMKWRDALARDPWVDECVSILGDMK